MAASGAVCVVSVAGSGAVRDGTVARRGIGARVSAIAGGANGVGLAEDSGAGVKNTNSIATAGLPDTRASRAGSQCSTAMPSRTVRPADAMRATVSLANSRAARWRLRDPAEYATSISFHGIDAD
ncbi:hypothetical protein V3391_11765 [Luteimonas sp. SMYT11W]|uniref:Uncharacterized protein n=1 Tax=Luteimonas flava TaxID=3115822 RepID=A0ABU7WH97_9GAMM